jgi:hypothetical protein
MGYRLHYAQHYNPNWQGGFFGGMPNEWDALFHAKLEEDGWKAEYSDEYEVSRDVLYKYIETLHDNPDEKNEFFKELTNKEVMDILSEFMKSDDEYIRIEWF